jgi:type VI secretion system protein ImpB
MLMAKNSGQRFIKRNRPPRVHITYDDPTNAEQKIELPCVMGVMSDLSGNNPGADKVDIEQRKFLDIDMDNIDNRMAAIQPGVNFRVANKLAENTDEKMSVSLRFNKMADFEPAAIAKQVPALAKLLEARTHLANLLRYMDGKVAAEESLKKLLADPQLMLALKNRESSNDDKTGS